MTRTALLALSVTLASPVSAQVLPDPAMIWAGLPLSLRLDMQVKLIAAGYLTRVPNVDFNDDIYNAVVRYQSTHGGPATGILNPRELNDLGAIAEVPMATWGLRTVRHPRGGSLIVPTGFGLVPSVRGDLISLDSPDDRLRVKFGHHAGHTVAESYRRLIEETLAGRRILYAVERPDFFAGKAELNGRSVFYRFHAVGGGVTGFMLSWRTTDGDVRGDRLATLMSASLWASMTGAPMPLPPVTEIR